MGIKVLLKKWAKTLGPHLAFCSLLQPGNAKRIQNKKGPSVELYIDVPVVALLGNRKQHSHSIYSTLEDQMCCTTTGTEELLQHGLELD